MENRIKRFNDFLNESIISIDEKIKQYVLEKYYDDDILEDCLRMKYGRIIPLFHATDEESAAIIEKEGLRPVEWAKNRTTGDVCVYFQIGRCDYIDDDRSVLFKWDCPLEYFGAYVYVDVDSVYTSDEELEEMGFDVDAMASEARDFLSYFVANEYKLEGMEIFFANRNEDPDFPKMMAERIN